MHALEQEGLSPKEAQYEADYGGLKIKLSIDLNMQKAAQQAVDEEFPPSDGPADAHRWSRSTTSTGEVRAMVSGDGDYDQSPFNLATMGYRQPGSSFKIFTLAAALESGKYSPYSEFDSQQLTIPFVNEGRECIRGRQRHRQIPGPQLRQRVQRLDTDDGGHRHLGQQRLRSARH